MTKRIKNNHDYETMRFCLTEDRDFSNYGNTFWGSTTYFGTGQSTHAIPANAEYYIYSYATPIAYRMNDGWHHTNEKHSRTTTNHQSIAHTITTSVYAGIGNDPNHPSWDAKW